MTQCTPDQAAEAVVSGLWRRITSKAAVLAGRAALCMALVAGVALPAHAETGGYIVFDVATGEIFARHNADQAWYPASITKLMTTYVTFQMIKAGRLTFNSPVVMSAAAAAQPPSKMGFPVGTVITIDNALKMIMVKSANDVAWALGESVGGSKPAFVAMMNDYARRIGMTETVWDNPNGLPDPNQMTTAHDMGLLARALLREFPEYDFYYRLPGIQLGNRVIANHNHLMDHYPGADGMKTGYICAAGFNVVASATRNGHRVVAVVLGSRGARPRAELAADLFNHAFDRTGSSGFFGFGGQTETLDNYRPGPEANQPVGDIHAEICGGKRNTGSEESIDDAAEVAASAPVDNSRPIPPGTPQRVARAELLSPHFNIGPPVKVWLGGADSVGTRAALADAPAPVLPSEPKAASLPAAKAALPAPRARAPGAIMPLQPPPASGDATTPLPPDAAQSPQQTPPAQDTPIVRAFTLFQPPPAATVPSPSTESQAAVAPPVDAPSADPAPDAADVKVPVPKQRPAARTHSADSTPTTKKSAKTSTAPAKPSKPAKAKKPVKPDTEN